jgi:hypothetical protein
VEKIGKKQLRIVLTQGLNRQIRRMCEYFGYRVEKLVRVRVMNIELGDLLVGQYREVTPEEYRKLERMLAGSSNAPVIPHNDTSFCPAKDDASGRAPVSGQRRHKYGKSKGETWKKKDSESGIWSHN